MYNRVVFADRRYQVLHDKPPACGQVLAEWLEACGVNVKYQLLFGNAGLVNIECIVQLWQLDPVNHSDFENLCTGPRIRMTHAEYQKLKVRVPLLYRRKQVTQAQPCGPHVIW